MSIEKLNNTGEQIQMGGLTPADFADKPEALEEFKVGDKLTRENFVSFLIQSFAISRGYSEAQWLFFEWLEKNYGFQSRETMDNFGLSGGWETLSSAEQEKMLEAFRRINAHTKKWMDFEHEDEIIQELDAFRPGARPMDTKFIKETINLEEVKTLSDLKQKISEYVEKRKSKEGKSNAY